MKNVKARFDITFDYSDTINEMEADLGELVGEELRQCVLSMVMTDLLDMVSFQGDVKTNTHITIEESEE